MKADLDEAQSRLAALENPNSTRVTRSAVQLIPDTAFTAVIFDAIRYDYGGQWSNATPTRLTAKTAGIYLIGACVEYTHSTAPGSRGLALQGNRGTLLPPHPPPPTPPNSPSPPLTTHPPPSP